jgi:hypothetical protein
VINRNANSPHIATGAAVSTSDGTRLGSVKEVTAASFKVDAPFHRDYWLAKDLVGRCDDDVVVLDVPTAAVDEHRQDAPTLTADDDPLRPLAGKPVIGDEELLAQRARVERELAEQSKNLPPHEPSPTEMRGPRAFERIPADHTGFNDLAGEYVPNIPVQDSFDSSSRSVSASARGFMIIAPIVFTAAALLGAVILISRLRRPPPETRAQQARRLGETQAQALRLQAQDRADAFATAAKPRIAEAAERGKMRGRRLLHDGLVAAANRIA